MNVYSGLGRDDTPSISAKIAGQDGGVRTGGVNNSFSREKGSTAPNKKLSRIKHG